MTTNPTAIAQHAAVAALTGPKEPIEAMRKAFEKRRNVIVEGLRKIPGIACRMPEGAFYAFADVRGLIGRHAAGTTLKDDTAVAQWMLESARCAVVPGTPFGAPGYVRISYAASEETLKEALSCIERAALRLE
jgi:aspartate aminotransferase